MVEEERDYLIPTIEDVIPDDVSSIESDRCWEEQYRGDSHKWLIRDAAKKKTNSNVVSTMKEHFPFPKQQDWDTDGIRKRMLREKLYREAYQEVLEEKESKPPLIADYSTTYNIVFNANGFKVKTGYEMVDEEMCKKYPLYDSIPTTFYQHLLNEKGSSVVMPGLTKVVDKRFPFKRSYAFTKSVMEGQDE